MSSKQGIAAFAVLAFAGWGAMPATAADLGGDCCADLEERIAELEATTARKGNRKVKLEVSGQVNEAILWWDDGVESNAGVYTNDDARTRFRFRGSAKISDDVSAGYLLEIGSRGANSKRFTQDNPDGDPDVGLDLRHSVWYLDSKKFGRVWVGLTGGAGENVTEVNLAATAAVAKYSDVEDTGLGLISLVDGVQTGVQWRRFIRDGGDQPGEGRRYNMVRYDTPEFMGFIATVNWGEDDVWEVGLRYKTDFQGFKLAAAVAYGESTYLPGNTTFAGIQCPGSVASNNPDTDCSQVGGSMSIMHEETGLYFNAAAGYMEDNVVQFESGVDNVDNEYSFWAIEAGLERKYWDFGKTTIFAQYYDNDGGTVDRSFRAGGTTYDSIVSSNLEMFGAGIVQGIDKAAMDIYFVYRHYRGDATVEDIQAGINPTDTFDLDDLDVFMGGGIIRF
jgi:predicted porin